MKIWHGVMAFAWSILSVLSFIHKLPEPDPYLLGGLVALSLALINGHRAFENH